MSLNMSQAVLDRISSLEAQMAMVQTNVSDYSEALNTIWLLLTGYLVWFMSAGFAFLELGGVRQKNSQNILAKNMLVPVLTFMGWYVVGFGLAFGVPDPSKPMNRWCGTQYFAMSGFLNNKALFKTWFFQGAFADTTASIVSGGIAERMTLSAFMIHTVCMTSIIYPICVYWAWSGSGWLNYPDPTGAPQMISSVGSVAYKDWAGSGVIHLVGGIAALVGAIIVGPRKGRFDPAVSQEEFAPSSVPFTVLGTFVLWFGWYGFNPGCISAMNTAFLAENAAMVVCNTTLAPVAAGLTAFLLRATIFAPHRMDVPSLCNGILAGLVAVTAACGWIQPWEAILIGITAGILYCISAKVIYMLKIDDPIEAVSVHAVNGAWGALAVGFYGNPNDGMGGNGVFYGGNQVGIQFLACLCFITWSATISTCIFLPLKYIGWLRWSDEFQDMGADEAQHSPKAAYNPASLISEKVTKKQQAEPAKQQAEGNAEAGVTSC